MYISGGGRASSANDNKDIMYYCVIADLPMVSMCRVRSKGKEQGLRTGVFFCFGSCYVLIGFSRGSQSVPQHFYPICFS